MYIHIIPISISVSISISISISILYLYIHTYTCIYIYIYVFMYMYACMHACMYVWLGAASGPEFGLAALLQGMFLGFRVWGLRDQGLGFRVQGSGFIGFRVQGLGFRVKFSFVESPGHDMVWSLKGVLH